MEKKVEIPKSVADCARYNKRGNHVRKQQTKEFLVAARFPFQYGTEQGICHGGSLVEVESIFLSSPLSSEGSKEKNRRHEVYKIKSDD